MNILTALIPLLGVVVGVTATYIVSGRSERLRHEYELKKHELELRERWDRTELDAYADYLDVRPSWLAWRAKLVAHEDLIIVR